MGGLNGLFVINALNFVSTPPNKEIPQLDSLVMTLDNGYYTAVVDGKTFRIPNFTGTKCTLNEHNVPLSVRSLGVAPYGVAIKLRKEAAEQFVEIFKEYPRLNDMSLIVYATSKQLSKM
eukprot:GHVT01041843.1.p1 GENE.GHVT01041843.1~~GHVT01041843.1.p1  ORF type:complete len:119 (+),score=3.76 GHVT01041843.1:219-575(+)